MYRLKRERKGEQLEQWPRTYPKESAGVVLTSAIVGSSASIVLCRPILSRNFSKLRG